jgi:hypothetical protein
MMKSSRVIMVLADQAAIFVTSAATINTPNPVSWRLGAKLRHLPRHAKRL